MTRHSVEGVPVVTQAIPGKGVVTDLTVTEQYIVLALDNAKLYVFNSDGTNNKTLHEDDAKPAWTTAVRNDTLVSGESGGDIRVWNLVTGLISNFNCNTQLLT
jgi:F-box and WD-40 domain protein CDC4